VAVLFGALPWHARAAEPAGRAFGMQEQQHVDNHLEALGENGIELDEIAEHTAQLIRICRDCGDVAVDYLARQGLGHENDQVRLSAAETLGLLGNPRALPLLLQMIEFDENYSVRRHAARSVAGFGNEPVLRRLFAELPDLDGSLRQQILSPRGETPEGAAARRDRLERLGSALNRALDRFESLVARMAANVDPDEQTRARLELQRLTGDVDRASPEDWRNWWLRRGRVPPALHEFVNVTADRTTMITLVELAALVDARNAEAGLSHCLQCGVPPVRMAAAEALGRLAASAPDDFRARAAGLLRTATADENGWVKASAIRALTICDAGGSAAEFRKLLADWAPDDRSGAHAILLQNVRRAAVAGIRAAQAGEARAELAELLVAPGSGRVLRWDLCLALAELGDASSLPALARHAAGGDAHERDRAFATIGTISDRLRAVPTAPDPTGQPEGELLRLATGQDKAQAIVAVYELDRRGTVDETLLDRLTGGLPEARMMALAAVARRRWAPALRAVAETAAQSGDKAELAGAACRTAVELGNPQAVREFMASTRRPADFSEADMADCRRRAATALLRLLETDTLRPDTAGLAATALAGLPSPEDEAMRMAVLGGLLRAMAKDDLAPTRAQIGAALRAVSQETFPDELRPWLLWWENIRKNRPNTP
jgi:HEAT repeat protein